MATVEKPQPMDVDPKKAEEKVEEKTELVNKIFCRVIIQSNEVLNGFVGSKVFSSCLTVDPNV